VTASALPIPPLPLVLSADAVGLERRLDGEARDIGGVRGDAFELGGLLGEDPLRLLAEALAAETLTQTLRDRLRQANEPREVIDELDRRRERLRRERRSLQDAINGNVNFDAAKREFADDVERQTRDSLRQLSNRGRAGRGEEVALQIAELRDRCAGGLHEGVLRQADLQLVSPRHGIPLNPGAVVAGRR